MTTIDGKEPFVVVGGESSGGFDAWAIAVGDPDADWTILPQLPNPRFGGFRLIVGGRGDWCEVK